MKIRTHTVARSLIYARTVREGCETFTHCAMCACAIAPPSDELRNIAIAQLLMVRGNSALHHYYYTCQPSPQPLT